MRVAGLGDRPLPAPLAAGVFARCQAEGGAKRLRTETCPVAELDCQPERGQRRDAAQAAKAADDLGERRLRREVADRLVERVTARLRLHDRPVALVEGQRERPALERLSPQPGVVRAGPGASRRTPARGAIAASGVDAGRASDRRARPHAPAPDRAPPPHADSATPTATSSPRRNSRASRSASPRSVLTLSPGGRWIFDGAATVHTIPRRRTGPGQPVPGQARLVSDRHQPRQSLQPRDRLGRQPRHLSRQKVTCSPPELTG